jgi:hypothetical protein
MRPRNSKPPTGISSVRVQPTPTVERGASTREIPGRCLDIPVQEWEPQLLLGICPRGNHRDDDIATVSMIYYVFIEYLLKTTCIDWQLCELFVKLFYLYGYSKVVPNRSLCEDTHEY